MIQSEIIMYRKFCGVQFTIGKKSNCFIIGKNSEPRLFKKRRRLVGNMNIKIPQPEYDQNQVPQLFIFIQCVG